MVNEDPAKLAISMTCSSTFADYESINSAANNGQAEEKEKDIEVGLPGGKVALVQSRHLSRTP